MEAFLTSAGAVAIAEIGDKTQLLALVLAARFGKPLSILAGILIATLANHALAAWAGSLAAAWLDARVMAWALAVSFLAMAVWTLIPDKLEEGEAQPRVSAAGAFAATLISFFLVEMGDKTQIATIALGARYHDVAAVTAGTTLGMMLANAPAVLVGEAALKIAPLRLVRIAAASLFAVLGVIALWSALALGA